MRPTPLSAPALAALQASDCSDSANLFENDFKRKSSADKTTRLDDIEVKPARRGSGH